MVGKCALAEGAAFVAITTAVLAFVPPALAQGARKPAAKPAAAPAPAIKPLIDTLQGDARTEYQAGKVLFDDGDFATALQKFRNAQAKQPDPRLLYNMAAAEKSLRHYTSAAKLLRAYLAEGGGLVTADDRREAEELVKVIDALTTPVTIVVSEERAQVFLDDELLGVSPLPAGLVVDIGQRKLRAQKDGFRTLVMPVQIGPAQTFEMTLEPQRGKLELKTKTGATVLIDDKPIGTGPLVVADGLPVGGHSLRITAPRMRTYQGEIVLEDGKARSLDIELEPDPEQLAELRVAVGCADPRVRSPEQGLTVFLDDASESASPLGTRKRIEDAKEVPAFVPFTVSPGTHRVRVRFPGCDPLETTAAVPAGGGAVEVSGMLPPENPWFNGSPAGSPNGFRASIGVTFGTLHFDRFDGFIDKRSPMTRTSADVTLGGPSVAVGSQTRWFMGVIEARYLFGSTDQGVSVGDPNNPNALPRPAPGAPTSEGASVSEWDVGVKIGPRIPLNIASLGFGALAGAGVLHVSPDGESSGQTGAFARGGGWAGVEAQPLCDFSLGTAFSLSAVAVGGPGGEPTTEQAWTIHVGYQPNVLCRRKRAGLYDIRAASR